MNKIMKNESDFHIENKEQKSCRRCKTPINVEQKWLLELPNIFTIGLQYADLECQLSREEL